MFGQQLLQVGFYAVLDEPGINATARRFGYPDTLIACSAHWLVLLRPEQPTLGSLVLAARGEAQAFTLENSTAYSIYRLTFTGPREVRLAGIALTGQGYDTRNQRVALGYRRALETATGVHYTRFASITGAVLREAFAAGRDFAEADQAFHAAILAKLDNELMIQLSDAFWQVHTSALPLLDVPPAGDIRLTVEAHDAIVDALEAGDAEAYARAVHAHYAPLERALTAASD